jgi:cytochrome oxidase Cu insertion factor (SCO1/SenC/PrrC family)
MIFPMMIRTLIAASLAAGVVLSFPANAADPKAPAAARRASPVKTGELAPDFTLTDQNGRSHALSAERGKRAVVLVFYRGYW